jgi:AAA15 family ATPase/GTPase
MLLSFRVENHKSIREEQQLLLTPTYDDAQPESADWEAVTVAGIFGANASGKSNLLDALSFMRDTVRWSMSRGEPGSGIHREPFALDAEAATDPSIFVIDLMLSGVRYTYGFSINGAQVLEEWLYTYPKRRKRVVFDRDGEEFEFGDSAPAKLRQVRDITGPNVLLLTVAARASNEEVEPVYRWFSDGLKFAEERNSGLPGWLRDSQTSEEQMAGLSELLRSADTGVRSVEVRKPEEPRIDVDHGNKVFGEAVAGKVVQAQPIGEVHVYSVHGKLSQRPGRLNRLPELLFHHSEGERARPLSWSEESNGTRTLTALGYEAQRVLETGGVLVVDEIDASLHPHLSAQVILHFQDERRNPHGAQLIFTSHDAALLGQIRGEEVLKRDHIWFVEKNGQGQSSLYPLSDFKPRGDDNRSRRYLVGRYGGVPDLDEELFRSALSRRKEREGVREDLSG